MGKGAKGATLAGAIRCLEDGEVRTGIDRECDDNPFSNERGGMFLLGKPGALKGARRVWKGE